MNFKYVEPLAHLSAENKFVRASAFQRSINYLVDAIAFNIILLVFMYFVTALSIIEVEDLETNSLGFEIFERLAWFVAYAFYMGIFETLCKGKSLGKFLTGTKAVFINGDRLSIYAAFARGFFRVIPFNPLSAFGTPCRPWHDKWTDTMVIDENRSYI
jgi:uncharacterized RDD family membrane protein YckC